MRLFYVAFYDVRPDVSVRNISPAAVSKINYIAKCLLRSEIEVEIFSAAWGKKPGAYSSSLINTDGVPVLFPPNVNYYGPFSGILKAAVMNLWLLWQLLSKTRSGESVLVYHSLVVMPAIVIAKVLKSLEVALEVEELYTSVGRWGAVMRYIERLYVRKIGAWYMLSTEMLDSAVPISSPRIYIYGSYDSAKLSRRHGVRLQNRIRLLYAGIIDSQKLGAFNAVRAAAFLDNRYELHIVGFGDVDDLVLEIDRVNSLGKCKVTYDGYMSGARFDEYCGGFDIGLSTQSSSGDYVSSSFPSKILTYLAYGMRVVSPHIDCVARSEIAHLVSYYYSDSPEEIAKSIMSVNIDEDVDCAGELNRLDNEFRRKLPLFFE